MKILKIEVLLQFCDTQLVRLQKKKSKLNKRLHCAFLPSYDATLAPATQLVPRRCHRHLQQHWRAHSVGAWLSPSSCRILSKDLRDIRKLSVHYPSLSSLFLPLSAASPCCAPASKLSARSVIPLMVARLSAGSGACCTTRMQWSLFSCIAANTLRGLLCKS